MPASGRARFRAAKQCQELGSTGCTLQHLKPPGTDNQTHSRWVLRSWWGQSGASREDLQPQREWAPGWGSAGSGPRQCHKAAHWQGWGCCSGCTCFVGATCPHQDSAHVLPMGLLRDDPDRGMWCGVGCPCRVQPVPSGAGQCHSMGFILPCSEQRADGWST